MDILFIFVIGSIFGSFFGLIVDRIPLRKSIIFGRSHCDSCQQLLAYRDLIPIFSQISSGSHCRYCKSKIPYLYVFLEFSSALIFVLAWVNYLKPSQFLLIILSLILSAFDYRQHSFPFVIWFIFYFQIKIVNFFIINISQLNIFKIIKCSTMLWWFIINRNNKI